jgi:hypothetical protein
MSQYSTLTIYKVGRLLRRAGNRPGIGSLFAQGTYALTYRAGVLYENEHAPFFLFIEEQAARAFLVQVQERFEDAIRLALWRGGAAECWTCPGHVYLGYKRERWPAFWRAYKRMRGAGAQRGQSSEEEFFRAVASHPLASPVAPGTVLCPAFQLEECLCEVRGALG